MNQTYNKGLIQFPTTPPLTLLGHIFKFLFRQDCYSQHPCLTQFTARLLTYDQIAGSSAHYRYRFCSQFQQSILDISTGIVDQLSSYCYKLSK